MILSNNLENEFIDFVSGLLEEHLCNTDKSFFAIDKMSMVP